MSVPSPRNSHRLSWSSFGMTNTGKVRKHNEDSMLEQPETGLWVVADAVVPWYADADPRRCRGTSAMKLAHRLGRHPAVHDSTQGVAAGTVTGAKSFNGSYGSLRYVLTLAASVPIVPEKSA